MYKYIGISLLTAICTYAGYTCAQRYRTLTARLESAVKFAEHIRSRIEFFNEPLDSIYEKYQDERISDFLVLLPADDLYGAWTASGLRLDKEGEKLFAEFCSGLGRGSREEQLRFCGYSINSMRAAYEKAYSELPKKTGLCSSMGLTAGLLAAVILL